MTLAGTPSEVADLVLAAAAEKHGKDNVGPYELAFMYESMQANADRKKKGVYYTPRGVAQPMTRMALEAAVAQLKDGPHAVLAICLIDPAVGCGPFLVEAARELSLRYAKALCGEPNPDVAVAVTPHIVLNCLFGVDIDPVAVELAKRALSAETGGTVTPAMLDRHIIAGNVLVGDSPPAMDDRTGPPPPRFDLSVKPAPIEGAP